MRHRLGYNHLSRPTAHRMLMLRNLVSSLLEHQQITTTVAKAKAAQRLADQVIHWGKQGGHNNWTRANAFLLNPQTTLEPLFSTLATRYASRPGGYTRILRAGHRVGDRAPLAILELVDNRNDLRYETAAKALGRELAIEARRSGGPEVWWTFRKQVEADGEEGIVKKFEAGQQGIKGVGDMTRRNIVKALAFRPEFTSTTTTTAVDAATTSETIHPSTQFLNRAHHHYLHSLAEFQLSTSPALDPTKTVKQLSQRLNPSQERGAPKEVVTVPMSGRRPRAGERTDGWDVEVVDAMGKLQLKGGPISRAKAGRAREARKAAQQ